MQHLQHLEESRFYSAGRFPMDIVVIKTLMCGKQKNEKEEKKEKNETLVYIVPVIKALHF